MRSRRLGLDEVYRELDPSEVRARFDSPVARRGIDVVHAALVQPARLARGFGACCSNAACGSSRARP